MRRPISAPAIKPKPYVLFFTDVIVPPYWSSLVESKANSPVISGRAASMPAIFSCAFAEPPCATVDSIDFTRCIPAIVLSLRTFDNAATYASIAVLQGCAVLSEQLNVYVGVPTLRNVNFVLPSFSDVLRSEKRCSERVMVTSELTPVSCAILSRLACSCTCRIWLL